ncbi:hypothetical protein [Lentilactobacillus buchneri]|uniref:hypothetical protein n=1 Tax=Lentilactobacillus buchneri TaxID=1581 RepID=UPI0021A82958|nr:hypothetical protein [Lentilactobacillus buchneri]
MTRKEIIDYIINNSFRFTEKNRDLLESLNDQDLIGAWRLVESEAKTQLHDAVANLS